VKRALPYLCVLGLLSVGTSFAGAISDCPGTPLDNSSGTYAWPESWFGASVATCGNVVGNSATGGIVLTVPSDVGLPAVESFLGLSAQGDVEGNTGSAIKFTDFNAGASGGQITFDYITGTGTSQEYFDVLGSTVNSLSATSGMTVSATIQVPDNFSGIFGIGMLEVVDGADPKMQLTNITFTPAGPTVPEPGSLALLAFGLVGLGLFKKARTRG
jgi:hypothetical protein